MSKNSLIFFLILLLYPDIGMSQDSTHMLSRFVTASGGIHFSHGGQYFLSATVGESITGNTQNENGLLRSGYWSNPFPFSSGTEENNLTLLPGEFRLYQNYPNPFNPSTVIRYDLPKPSNVKLEIFNILGERIITLVNSESFSAGYRQVIWNGRNNSGNQVGSGIYIYRLQIKPEADPKNLIQFIKKMIYLK